MAEQDTNRNQEATPYKLQEARKKGQVAKSTDVTSVIVYTVAIVYMYWHGWDSIKRQFLLCRTIFTNLNHIDSVQLLPVTLRVMMSTLEVIAPFFITICIAAIIANLIQTGPVLSSHPVQPDFSRLNPAQGFKKLFSGKTLFEVFRSLCKLILLTLILYLTLKAILPKLFLLPWLTPVGYIKTLLDAISSLGLKLALVLVLIAIIDLIYTRRLFAKQMNMSHREIKDESKNREGDPRVRSRMRQLRMEMRKRSMSVMKTASADVVITNPTHLAVALRYEHGKMESPLMVAKGAGLIASVMRSIARKNNIPIVQNKSLARALYKRVETEQHVPIELYAEVAKIIVWVFALRRPAVNERGLH